MKFVIFSFAIGDYLCDSQNHLLVFDSRGLALQYLREHYREPIPTSRTKKFIHYTKYYKAPFRLHEVC
ncbi:TPA: hypothetical protein VJE30_001321 [Streptococcus pyogenes]|nr:hypothetical protein [Streptococcus pyogenes]